LAEFTELARLADLANKIMNKDIIEQIKFIGKTYDIWPERNKGQNFLINVGIVEEMIAAAELSAVDEVLEVGPGLGILTEGLIKKAKRVVSVELDDKIFGFLKIKFAEVKNLELVNADILKYNPVTNRLRAGNYKIIANLPYNITSFFLKTFLTGDWRPKSMTLLLQKEVAQRICAGSGKMSLLAISVQLYGEPKIVGYVGNNNFWPKPAVDSAIIKIDRIKNSALVDKYLDGVTEKEFWRLAKIGFSAKRKQLQHNLAAGLKQPAVEVKKMLISANFDEKIRAENLSVDDWIRLAKKFKNHFN